MRPFMYIMGLRKDHLFSYFAELIDSASWVQDLSYRGGEHCSILAKIDESVLEC